MIWLASLNFQEAIPIVTLSWECLKCSREVKVQASVFENGGWWRWSYKSVTGIGMTYICIIEAWWMKRMENTWVVCEMATKNQKWHKSEAWEKFWVWGSLREFQWLPICVLSCIIVSQFIGEGLEARGGQNQKITCLWILTYFWSNLDKHCSNA